MAMAVALDEFRAARYQSLQSARQDGRYWRLMAASKLNCRENGKIPQPFVLEAKKKLDVF